MTVPPDRFEEVLEDLENRRSDYVIESSNWLEGQSLLSSITDIKNACVHVSRQGGDVVTDSEWFHLFYTAASTDYFEASYLLISHNLYRLTGSQRRTLFEIYLLLRGLNEDKEKAAKLYRETRDQARETWDFVGTRPVTATPFHRIVKDQRDQVPEEMQDLFWNHPSWEAVHPQSIVSLWIDGAYDEKLEKNSLNGTILLAFLIATQYLRAFEGTRLEDGIREHVDPLFTRAKLSLPGEPKVPEEDLVYW